jgi:hypothetical protein
MFLKHPGLAHLPITTYFSFLLQHTKATFLAFFTMACFSLHAAGFMGNAVSSSPD